MPLKSFSYSIPYLILLLLFIFCSFKSYKGKTDINVKVICNVAFFIFFGLRGFVGYDWTWYQPFFDKLEPIYSDFFKNFELHGDFGFVIFSTLIKSFIPTYTGYLCINVLIDCIVLNYVFTKYSMNYPLSFAIYLFVCMGMEMDTMRSLKALEVYLIALQYVSTRKLKKFLLLCFIAFSLHASAILYIPTYWILTKQFKRSNIIIFAIIINIIYVLQIPILKPILQLIGDIGGGRIKLMVDLYLASDLYNVGRGISPSYLERLLTMILVLCYYKSIVVANKSNIMFVNLFWIYLVIVLLGSEMIIIESRVGNMFIFTYTIVWPAILNAIRRTFNYKLFYTTFVVMCVIFVGLRTNNIMYLYENVLCDSMSYNKRYWIFENEGAKLSDITNNKK